MREYISAAAAIAEVVLVLVLGLLAISTIGPFLLDHMPQGGSSIGPMLEAALREGSVIAVRFALLISLGFSLLWFRWRVSPNKVGVTLRRNSTGKLLSWGLIGGAVAALPWKVVVLLNSIWPLGSGLGAWDEFNSSALSAELVISIMLTAMVLPPILEEVFVRGYVRGRLAISFGAASAVVLSAIIFGLSHGHFYSDNPVVHLIGASSVFAAAVWGWMVWRTGSVIPAMIGHALLNSPEPSDPAAMGTIVAVLVLVTASFARSVAREFRAIARQLAAERWPRTLLGLGMIAAIFALLVWRRDLAILVAVAAASLVVLDAFVSRQKLESDEISSALRDGSYRGDKEARQDC